MSPEKKKKTTKKKQEQIDKLTPKQEALLDVYADKYTAIAHSTEPVNVKTAAATCERLYTEILEIKFPGFFLAESPMAAWKKVLEVTPELDKKSDPVWPYLCGHYDSYLFAFYDYCREVLKIEYDTPLYDVWRATMEMGPIWTLDNLCIVSDRPKAGVKTKDFKLHCDGGPACDYGDGFRVFALNGVRVPEWLAVTPRHKLDPKRFAECKNVEVRREFVRKVGVEAITNGAKVLDTKGDYSLILVDLGGATGKWPYLKMMNPSIGVWHVECVPKSCKTVQDALNARAAQLGDSLTTNWNPAQLT